MKVVESRGEGVLAPPGVRASLVGLALAALCVAVLRGAGAVPVAVTTMLIVIIALTYPRFLRWRNLVALLILVICFLPIRRYVFPGDLPIEPEPYRLLVGLIILGWIASALVDPRVRLRGSRFDAPLLAFACATFASVVVNDAQVKELGVENDVAKSLTFFLSFFLLFYVVVSVIRSRRSIDFLLKILVSGGALVTLLALVEYRTGYNLFNDLPNRIPHIGLNLPPDLVGIHEKGRLRAYASAQHPIALSAALVMLVPLAAYLARRSGNRRWWLVGCLLLLGALATLSATAVVMLAFAGAIFLWLRPRETMRLAPALLPAAIVIHFAVPGAIGTLKESFFPPGGLIASQKTSPESEVSAGRIADIGPTLEEFASRPLLGQGFGTRIVEGERRNARILDDQWLATLLETGIIGAATLVWLFLRAIRQLALVAREDGSSRGWLCAALAASIGSYAGGMFVFDAFSFIQVTFILFILLAFAAVVVAQEEQDSKLGRSA